MFPLSKSLTGRALAELSRGAAVRGRSKHNRPLSQQLRGALACSAALVAMAIPAPGRAQGLPLSLNFLSTQGLISLSTSADLLALQSDLPELQNVTIKLNVDLPSGFPLTSNTCTGPVSLVSLGNHQYGVTAAANLPVAEVLKCTLDTLNTLQSSLGTIVPLLARQNDFLMSLDLGLERQIDLLSVDHGADDDPIWDKAYSLGGPDEPRLDGGRVGRLAAAIGWPV